MLLAKLQETPRGPSEFRHLDGDDSDRDSLSDMDMTVYGLVADSIRNRNRSFWKRYQPKVWTTFEEPYSSRLAQVILIDRFKKRAFNSLCIFECPLSKLFNFNTNLCVTNLAALA